jgi:hypothetical protein
MEPPEPAIASPSRALYAQYMIQQDAYSRGGDSASGSAGWKERRGSIKQGVSTVSAAAPEHSFRSLYTAISLRILLQLWSPLPY